MTKRNLRLPSLLLAAALLFSGCGTGNTDSPASGGGEPSGLSSVSIIRDEASSREDGKEEALPPEHSLPSEESAPSAPLSPENADETSAPEEEISEPAVPEVSQAPAESSAEPPTESAVESSAEPSAPQELDAYQTVPVPEGKPDPVEPQEASVDEAAALSCTFSIRCDTILDNMDRFDSDKLSVLPADGVIFAEQTVTFYEGESVFDVLLRATKDNKIHMEFNMTPMYNSAYIEGINNIYEFDCGDLSGWMFKVNGWFPNYGCSRYQLSDGDVVEWLYTCDLGRDLGKEIGE